LSSSLSLLVLLPVFPMFPSPVRRRMVRNLALGLQSAIRVARPRPNHRRLLYCRPALVALLATVPLTPQADTCASCVHGRHPPKTSGSGVCASGVTCPTGLTVHSRYLMTVYCYGVCACVRSIESIQLVLLLL
jgi:hypothetical protein